MGPPSWPPRASPVGGDIRQLVEKIGQLADATWPPGAGRGPPPKIKHGRPRRIRQLADKVDPLAEDSPVGG